MDGVKHRVAYLEWFEAPAEEVRNGGCMILISGGSYQNCSKNQNLTKPLSANYFALNFSIQRIICNFALQKAIDIS